MAAMEHHEKKEAGPGSPEDVQNIMGAALFAIGHGARGVWINLRAVETLRGRFLDKIRSALQEPDWRSHWREEEVYLMAQAEAMGQRAALLAAEEGRTSITEQDVDQAMAKVRGHLPVAGRWCPS